MARIKCEKCKKKWAMQGEYWCEECLFRKYSQSFYKSVPEMKDMNVDQEFYLIPQKEEKTNSD